MSSFFSMVREYAVKGTGTTGILAVNALPTTRKKSTVSNLMFQPTDLSYKALTVFTTTVSFSVLSLMAGLSAVSKGIDAFQKLDRDTDLAFDMFIDVAAQATFVPVFAFAAIVSPAINLGDFVGSSYYSMPSI